MRLTLPPGTPAGTQATLKHAEVLAHEPLAPADGSVYMGNLFWANPVDVCAFKARNAAPQRRARPPRWQTTLIHPNSTRP